MNNQLGRETFKDGGIGWAQYSNGSYYVAQIPGEGGKGWGWTKNLKEARILNEQEQNSFMADCDETNCTNYVIYSADHKKYAK